MTPEEKLGNFLSGFGAAVHLSEIAKKNGSYIEQVCLFANIIDGLLRLSLIMKEQIDNATETINEIYLFQADEDRIMTEKKIYDISLEKNIITAEVKRRLYDLYAYRNKIIHRYIISDIRTNTLREIAQQYDSLMIEIGEIHRPLNDRLVKENFGIAKFLMQNPTRDDIADQILVKHGGLFKKKLNAAG